MSGFFYINFDPFTFSRKVVWLVFIITIFHRKFNADSGDLDKTPHSAASDFGRHC